MNLTDIAEVKERSEPEFREHADSAGIVPCFSCWIGGG